MGPSDTDGAAGGTSTSPNLPGGARRGRGAAPSTGEPAAPAPGPITGGPAPTTGGAPTTGNGPLGPATGPAPFNPVPNPAFTGNGDRPVLDLEGWQLWWDVQRRGYLMIKDSLANASVSTGTSDYFLGQGQKEQVSDWNRPTPEQIRDRIVPALISALNANKAPELRAGCIVALGRLGDLLEGDVQGRVTGALARELGAEHAQVRETAALALGLLGHDDALDILFELLADSEQGREFVDRGNVMPRTRAFASLGLALGARKREASVRLRVGRELSERLVELRELADAEAAACCLIAVGLSPQPFAPSPPNAKLPGPGLSEQIAQVLDLTLDRGTRVAVAAHGPEALARLVAALPDHPAAAGERSRVVRALLDVALERGAARQLNAAVRDGALLALGELAPEFDGEQQRLVADGFERVLERSTGMGPAYALLGLGRLAAFTEGGFREDLEKRLAKELQNAPHRRGAWASLALGLSVHESEAGRVVPAHLRTLWANTLERARSPEFASAVGVSVGLARLSQEETRLLRQFEDLGEDLARGYLAEALGLAGARGARELLGFTLDESTNRPLLLGKVAMALGLLEDGTVQTRLLEALQDSSSAHAQGYLAAAVGVVGDVRAIAPLTRILEDESRDARLRAFAAAALGRIADPDRLPWNAVLARGLNYRHAPASLFDGSGRGALELL